MLVTSVTMFCDRCHREGLSRPLNSADACDIEEDAALLRQGAHPETVGVPTTHKTPMLNGGDDFFHPHPQTQTHPYPQTHPHPPSDPKGWLTMRPAVLDEDPGLHYCPACVERLHLHQQ